MSSAYRNVPAYFTWEDYTPTLGAKGSMTFTSTSILAARFLEIGDLVHVQVHFTGTTGGTADPSLTCTLPTNAVATDFSFACTVNDGSGAAIAPGTIIPNG